MSLNDIVKLLTEDDASISQFRRAIRLFEFQVSVFYPLSFKRLIASEGGVTVPNNKMLRAARIFAGIQILENIEAGLQQGNNGNAVISIRELAADESYRSVFNDMMATCRGWSGIRHKISANAFDRRISEQRGLAITVANIVDCSYRFRMNHAATKFPRKTNPSGVDMAKFVVQDACKPLFEETTTKNRWRKFKLPGIFLYLMLIQKFDMEPAQVSSKKFAEKLLRQADNLDEIRRFFCAYQTVRDTLLHAKYKVFPELALDLRCSPPQLDAAKFSPEMNRAFQKWLAD